MTCLVLPGQGVHDERLGRGCHHVTNSLYHHSTSGVFGTGNLSTVPVPIEVVMRVAIVLVLLVVPVVFAQSYVLHGTVIYASRTYIHNLHVAQYVCARPEFPTRYTSSCGWAYSRWPWRRFQIGQIITMYETVCLSGSTCFYRYALRGIGR